MVHIVEWYHICFAYGKPCAQSPVCSYVMHLYIVNFRTSCSPSIAEMLHERPMVQSSFLTIAPHGRGTHYQKTMSRPFSYLLFSVRLAGPIPACQTTFRNEMEHIVVNSCLWLAHAHSLHWGLSPGPSVYRTDALPLSYRGHTYVHRHGPVAPLHFPRRGGLHQAMQRWCAIAECH